MNENVTNNVEEESEKKITDQELMSNFANYNNFTEETAKAILKAINKKDNYTLLESIKIFNIAKKSDISYKDAAKEIVDIEENTNKEKFNKLQGIDKNKLSEKLNKDKVYSMEGAVVSTFVKQNKIPEKMAEGMLKKMREIIKGREFTLEEGVKVFDFIKLNNLSYEKAKVIFEDINKLGTYTLQGIINIFNVANRDMTSYNEAAQKILTEQLTEISALKAELNRNMAKIKSKGNKDKIEDDSEDSIEKLVLDSENINKEVSEIDIRKQQDGILEESILNIPVINIDNTYLTDNKEEDNLFISNVDMDIPIFSDNGDFSESIVKLEAMDNLQLEDKMSFSLQDLPKITDEDYDKGLENVKDNFESFAVLAALDVSDEDDKNNEEINSVMDELFANNKKEITKSDEFAKSILEKYKNIKQIGKGGCGIVYSVEARTDTPFDPKTGIGYKEDEGVVYFHGLSFDHNNKGRVKIPANKEIVIKIDISKSENANKNLIDEAKLLQKMNKAPHGIGFYEIITEIDFKTGETFSAIVMEKVDGKSMELEAKKRVKSGENIDIITGIQQCIDIAEYNASMHSLTPLSNGEIICNRDIKLDNMIINEKGEVISIDVGGSNFLEGNEGNMVGTYFYMGISQFFAEEKVIPENDVYGAAVCYYRMLTGEYPIEPTEDEYFSANNLFILMLNKKIENKIMPPIDINPDIPQEVSDLIMKMLERDPKTGVPVYNLEQIKKDSNGDRQKYYESVLARSETRPTMQNVADRLKESLKKHKEATKVVSA